MSLSESPRGEPNPAAHVNTLSQDRLTCSQVTSYDAPGVKVNRPRRVRYPNLSPTRAPAVAADAALWPHWTKLRVEEIDYDAFDDDGYQIGGEGGEA